MEKEAGSPCRWEKSKPMPARILVIEDNPTNLELMTYLLRAFGHTVISQTNGTAGCEAIRRERPDLVVCDIQLPGMTGYDIARAIKADKSLHRIPMIAVTAFAMVGDKDKVLLAGFDGYITKPITPEIFVTQIEKFLPPDLHSKPFTPTENMESPPPAPHRAKILVLDDSQVNHEVLRGTFEPLGYQMFSAHNVSEAVALTRESVPDLILSDLHLRGETGFQFIEAIKADPDLKEIPFVFLSSSVFGDRDRNRGLELGANKFIFRPIEPQLLLREVEDCLKGGEK
jgi:two-component system cell cycle response regulator